MAVAYAFSSYAGTNIFVASTPMVNRGYLADLQNQFKKGVNNVYLAFSIFNKKTVKKNIAVVPVTNNMSGKLGSPTAVPTKIPVIAKIEPSTIPDNLFKSISKGVSAYEPDNNHITFKFSNGAKLKTKKFQFPDGTVVDMLDFSE